MNEKPIHPILQEHLAEAPELQYPHFSKVAGVYGNDGFNLKKHMKYRNEILKQCKNDYDAQEEMVKMCAEDSLFWVTTFVTLFEPRPRPKILPFILWPHQIPVWKTFERYLGVRDVGLEKCRAEGASYMILALCLHKWLFTDFFLAGFVSKDEPTVDSAKPGSLFWKYDFWLGNDKRGLKPQLPEWMIPNCERSMTDHTWTNNENNSVFSGFAATGNVATGDRFTVMVMDELAKFPKNHDYDAMNSTRSVSYCRYLISTPFGPRGVFYDMMHKDTNMVKLRLHWTDNPTKNPGAYKVLIDTTGKRSVELIDLPFWKQMAKSHGHEFKYGGDVLQAGELIKDDSNNNPFGYEFMLTGPFVKHGMVRSPWYDFECRRPDATPMGISQELDIDYGGSAARYFDINMLTRLKEYADDPMCYGDMILPDSVTSHHDLENCEFQEQHGGNVSLWFDLEDLMGESPQGRDYTIGADVCTGTAGVMSSNSTLEVIDRTTGEQVAEFACPSMTPSQFAEYAIALCYWFRGTEGNGAFLIWEQNGPGTSFGKRVSDLGYPNIYYRGTVEETFERETNKIGFYTTPKTKGTILDQIALAMDRHDLVVKSSQLLDEAMCYFHQGGDKIAHIASATSDNPSAASTNHGDRVIALAIAWHDAKEYVVGTGGKSLKPYRMDIPESCFLARRLAAAREAARDRDFAWVPPSQRSRY